MSQQQFCTFQLGDHYFGVDITCVHEIIRHQKMTNVPLAHPIIKGLINLRGQIVTAIDLRKRLEMEESEKPPMNIVIRSTDGLVSLLVDEIGDVLEVEEKDYEQTPETLAKSMKEFITGTYKLKDRLMLVIDSQKIVQTWDEGEAADTIH